MVGVVSDKGAAAVSEFIAEVAACAVFAEGWRSTLEHCVHALR